MFKRAKHSCYGVRSMICIVSVASSCLAMVTAADTLGDNPPAGSVIVRAGHDTGHDVSLRQLETAQPVGVERPGHVATSMNQKLLQDEVPVVIGPDKKYVLIPMSMSSLFGKNADKLAANSDPGDPRTEQLNHAFICMRVDDVIDFCERHRTMLEKERTTLNAESTKHHAAIANALSEQKRAIDATHSFSAGIDGLLPILNAIQKIQTIVVRPMAVSQGNVFAFAQLQRERENHLKQEKELHRLLDKSNENVSKLNESVKKIESAHKTLTEASRALVTKQARLNSIGSEIGSLVRFRAAVAASLGTTLVAGGAEDSMPSFANELIGSWKAVARTPDVELTTIEFQFDDRGWGKLVFPGSAGKPATSFRIFVEDNELKLASEVTVGKVVDFDNRQMVIDHLGKTITVVRSH